MEGFIGMHAELMQRSQEPIAGQRNLKAIDLCFLAPLFSPPCGRPGNHVPGVILEPFALAALRKKANAIDYHLTLFYLSKARAGVITTVVQVAKGNVLELFAGRWSHPCIAIDGHDVFE